MATDKQHFSLVKVRALRAYFEQTRRGAKGRPECADLEITVQLCDQLIALMEPKKQTASSESSCVG
jgi:hypothetical protein